MTTDRVSEDREQVEAQEQVAEGDADDAAAEPDSGESEPGLGGDLPDIDAIDDPIELREVAVWLREELSACRLDRDEYLEHLLRTRAEFDNARKRMMKEQTEIVERAALGLLEALLPVLDSLDLAISNAPDGDPMRAGVEAVRSQMVQILEKQGLERVEPAAGEPFDPKDQEPVSHAEGGGDGQAAVVSVLRPGYRLKGRLLRPALVEVAG
jgi:molecular chaperone GrpE